MLTESPVTVNGCHWHHRMIAAIVSLFSESQPSFKKKPSFSLVKLYPAIWPLEIALSLLWPPTAIESYHWAKTLSQSWYYCAGEVDSKTSGWLLCCFLDASLFPLLVTKTVPSLASRTVPDTHCLSGEHVIEWLKEMSSMCYSNHVWLCYLGARMFHHLSFLRVLLHSQAQITGVYVWRVLKHKERVLNICLYAHSTLSPAGGIYWALSKPPGDQF